MKKQILLLTLLLSVTANTFAIEAENMLVNGGLEQWLPLTYPYDMPKGWFCHNNTNGMFYKLKKQRAAPPLQGRGGAAHNLSY